jgi:hypothetical protein
MAQVQAIQHVEGHRRHHAVEQVLEARAQHAEEPVHAPHMAPHGLRTAELSSAQDPRDRVTRMRALQNRDGGDHETLPGRLSSTRASATDAPEGAWAPESGRDPLPAQQPRRDSAAHEVHRRHGAIHRPIGNADGDRAHAAARRGGRRRRRMKTGRDDRGQKKTRRREATRTRRTAIRWRRTEEHQRTSARDGPALFNHAPTTYPYPTLDIISVTHARTTRGVAPAHA